MRKNELKKLPRLYLTKHMRNALIKDVGVNKKYHDEYKYTVYYRAAIHGDILFVAIWDRTSVLHLQKEPDFEIYIDKKNDTWINYSKITNSWGKARVENLNFGSTYGYDWYRTREYSTKTEKEKVNQYFINYDDTQYSIREAVRKWQKGLADERLIRVHRAELEEIDTVMENVPELPKNFMDWAGTGAYKKSQYLIFNRKEKDAFCTVCNQHMQPKVEWKHNEFGKCPHCRAEITYKSYFKQKCLSDRKRIGILQRMKNKDGYILRSFESQISRYQEKGYQKEFWAHEDYRYQITTDFKIYDVFEYGEYKYTGKVRWCHELPHGGYFNGYYNVSRDEVILYPQNIKTMLKDTKLKYSNLHVLFKHFEGCYLRPVNIMDCFANIPVTEVMTKVGLYNYTLDICKNRWNQKEWKKESPWNYLEITKDYFRMAVKHNCRMMQIDVMKSASERNIKLTWEMVVFYTKYLHGMQDEIFALGHAEKMYRYMKELSYTTTRLGDYMDYLHDLDYLEIPKTKEVLFPKNFATEHQQIALEAAIKRDEIKAKQYRQKEKLYKKMLPELKKLYECEDKELQIVIPTCKKDFTVEGQQNHNCVGGIYFDKVVEKRSVVVFLRKKEDLKQSFCTVEFDTKGNVLQNRAKYNHQAPEEAVAFINKLSKKVKKEIAKKEMEEIKKAEQMEALQTAAG